MKKLMLVAPALLVAGCTRSAPQNAPAPAANRPAVAAATLPERPVRPAPVVNQGDSTPAPVVVGERTPLGDPPRPVAESTTALDRSSPARTLAALAAALDRQDEPALARLCSTSGTKEQLDEADLLRARIDFLGPREPHWRRVLAAVDLEKLGALDASGERARLRVDVGGALGYVDLVFVKESGSWLVAL